MQKRFALLLSLFAPLAINTLAQNNPTHRSARPGDAYRMSDRESDLARSLESDNDRTPETLTRPRIVNAKASAVRSSIVVNATAAERTAFDMINRVRGEYGMQPLLWNNDIAAISRIHSQNMADFTFFSHKGIDRKMVSDRADDLGSRTWLAIGENIAFNRGFQDPIGNAVELWLNSPSHRRNLLDPKWKESAVGIAVARDGSYYLTQVFWVTK